MNEDVEKTLSHVNQCRLVPKMESAVCILGDQDPWIVTSTNLKQVG